MDYYIDLYSPETATAFEKSSRDVTGFRISRKTYIENRKIGKGTSSFVMLPDFKDLSVFLRLRVNHLRTADPFS
jgi:hypothetical protein